jgi:integrase
MPSYPWSVALADYAGFRLEEACNLKWVDVDLNGGELNFEGKGRKGRRVPISDDDDPEVRVQAPPFEAPCAFD